MDSYNCPHYCFGIKRGTTLYNIGLVCPDNSLIGAVGAVIAFCSDKKFPELELIYNKLLKLKLNENNRKKIRV